VAQYSVGPIITPHGRIAAREYVDKLDNQVHPTSQTLFPKKDAVFQDDDNALFAQLELFVCCGSKLRCLSLFSSFL
jgi:hypothetical protein